MLTWRSFVSLYFSLCKESCIVDITHCDYYLSSSKFSLHSYLPNQMISDSVYFYYFLVHLPITVFMDATFVIPTEYQLPIQKQLSLFHIQQNKHFLAVEAPLWVRLFVIWELVFQLPFFVYAAINYLQNGRTKYSERTWPMFLLYGFNAGFTSLVCLIYVWTESGRHGLTMGETANLLGLYTPTTLIPFYMMYDFWVRIADQLQSVEHDKKDL